MMCPPSVFFGGSWQAGAPYRSGALTSGDAPTPLYVSSEFSFWAGTDVPQHQCVYSLSPPLYRVVEVIPFTVCPGTREYYPAC